ncbi:uncharacterized protein GGQ84_000361 [Desulfitispora alkaliphila]|uniref:Tex family protein n=1 Tax=Desulfitispora alkaliphila TaxID=622674 RepID=UPI003D23F8D0
MIEKIIARELNLGIGQVNSVIKLLDEGNTIPFIARYRKEATGELDEVVLRQLEDRLVYLRNLEERKKEVIKAIGEQGKLTDELEGAINKAEKLQQVEDLYRPFKQKRRTKATIAKEKGLEPLADIILGQQVFQGKPEEIAKEFVNPEKEVNSPEEAIENACYIVAEIIADDPDNRTAARRLLWKKGVMTVRGETDERTPYEMYYNYTEQIEKLPPHRILAINRGEKEEVLKVKLDAPEEQILENIHKRFIKNTKSIFTTFLKEGILDGYKRLLLPAIEREIRNELTSKGEEQAIMVFKKNLRQLLLQPPIKGKTVLGVDPAYRTGCKLAVVDVTGKLLKTDVVYPHQGAGKWDQSKEVLARIIKEDNVHLIAIGNGTASRETETLIAEIIREQDLDVQYIIISEAGASVYSASEIARQEFPDFDLSMRSAVSIARRIQDPLAELVKIDPKSIGVGQYQHDIAPKKLSDSLSGVVEDCVNQVGVDVNTASPSLLKYVAGLSFGVAQKLVELRNEVGEIKDRKQLKKVPRLGDKAFTQCAGFIRVPEGDNWLDNTPVHPESYDLALKLLQTLDCNEEDVKNRSDSAREKLANADAAEIARQLDAGEPTVRDIIAALLRPGRDPREDLPRPMLRSDVVSMEDLKEGMVLQGTVRNVVDFGAFVDIGVKQDGLVHISNLSSKKFVKHPMEIVSVGDIVKVKIISIDYERERIGLSMREEDVN